MANITIGQSGTFRGAAEDVNSGKAKMIIVSRAKDSCHVVVSKDMENDVQTLADFTKSGLMDGLPTFFVAASAEAVMEKLSKRFNPEILLAVGEERKYLQGQIVVRRRSDDYMAYIFGDEARWEAGKTLEEAIGKLVKNQMS